MKRSQSNVIIRYEGGGVKNRPRKVEIKLDSDYSKYSRTALMSSIRYHNFCAIYLSRIPLVFVTV